MSKRSGNRNKINKLIRKRTKELLRNGRVAISLLVSVAIIIISIIISISIKSQAINEETMDPISDNVTMVKSSDGKWIPVPKGYSASKIPGEDSVDGGFVIYEGEDIDWTYWENLSSEASVASVIDETENDINTQDKVQDENQIDPIVKPEDKVDENSSEDNTTNKNVDNSIDNDEKNEDDIKDTANNTNDSKESEKTNSSINEESNKTNVDENKVNNQNYDEVIAVSAIKNTYMTSGVENESNIEPKEPENEIDNINKEPKEENIVAADDSITNLSQDDKIQDVVSPLADEEITDVEVSEDDKWMLEQDINTFNLQCSRNQYVWVPVDDPSEIYGVDANGKLWGKMYNFNAKGKTANNWTENNGVMKLNNLTRGLREPDVSHEDSISSQADFDYQLKNALDGATRFEFLSKELEEKFYNTIESIKKYGGFYIGRYETAGLNGTVVIKKMQTISGSTTWYTWYKKCNSLGIGNDAVTTNLIYGCLWEETIDWFVKSKAIIRTPEEKEITYSDFSINLASGAFKYYSDLNRTIATKEEGASYKIPTGSTEYTKINNIYDMVGNATEWTQSVPGTGIGGCRVYTSNTLTQKGTQYAAWSWAHVGRTILTIN